MFSIDDAEVKDVLQRGLEIITMIEAYKELLENRCDTIEAVIGIKSGDVMTALYKEYHKRYPLSLRVTSNPIDYVDTKLSEIIGDLK